MTPDKHSEFLVLVPHQLGAMYCAFDAVWPEVAPDYGGSPESTEAGRLRLANAVFAAYKNGFHEPATMAAYARHRMALWGQPGFDGIVPASFLKTIALPEPVNVRG